MSQLLLFDPTALPAPHRAGPKAGIYYKRIGASLDPGEQTLAAVLHLYPSATLCGASVLHRNGWTTQIPRSLQIAVEERPSLVQLHGVSLFPRPAEWFTAIGQNRGFEPNLRVSLETPSSRIRVLKPAWALEDMRSATDGWNPDDDDLDIPEDELTIRNMRRAKTVLSSIYSIDDVDHIDDMDGIAASNPSDNS